MKTLKKSTLAALVILAGLAGNSYAACDAPATLAETTTHGCPVDASTNIDASTNTNIDTSTNIDASTNTNVDASTIDNRTVEDSRRYYNGGHIENPGAVYINKGLQVQQQQRKVSK